jgi:hypothetical protein
LNKLFKGESGVGNDATERAASELLMVGHNGSCVRSIAAKYHMAALLPAEEEPGALQGSPDFMAR